jgi:hypothetical protein
MKKIRMLVDDKRLGFKKGEIYEVQPYELDPQAKMSCIKKIPDDGVYGRDSGFNVYRESRGIEWEWVKQL